MIVKIETRHCVMELMWFRYLVVGQIVLSTRIPKKEGNIDEGNGQGC